MRVLGCIVLSGLCVCPAMAQLQTLGSYGERVTTVALPGLPDGGAFVYPAPQVDIRTGYAVRFMSTEDGTLRFIRLRPEEIQPGRSVQSFHSGTHISWPLGFDYRPQTLVRHAVRFDAAMGNDPLDALEFYVREMTSADAFNDTLLVGLYPSRVRVDTRQQYATGDAVGATTVTAQQATGLRFDAPYEGLFTGVALDGIEAWSGGATDSLVVTWRAASAPPSVVERYHLGGRDFTFALGPDARQAYGLSFSTPPHPEGRRPLRAIDFFVFNLNDSRFFSGFDTPANDSLVATIYRADAFTGLPTERLMERVIGFSDLDSGTWNRLDLADAGLSFASDEQFVVGFSLRVVERPDIISFISGGSVDPLLRRTLVQVDGEWSAVADAPFYANRADRSAEILVEAVFGDPNQGVPDATVPPLARTAVAITGGDTAVEVTLPVPLPVQAGTTLWATLQTTGQAELRLATHALTNGEAQRVAEQAEGGPWRYPEAGTTTPKVTALFSEGAMPDEASPLIPPVALPLSDLYPDAPNAVRLQQHTGQVGQDVWAVFEQKPVGTPDHIALASGEAAPAPIQRTAAYTVYTDGMGRWSYHHNTFLAKEYPLAVQAFYGDDGTDIDDWLHIELLEEASDGSPGDVIVGRRYALADHVAGEDMMVRFDADPLRFTLTAGTPFFVALRLDPVNGPDAVLVAVDDGQAGEATTWSYRLAAPRWQPMGAGTAATPRLLADVQYTPTSGVATDREEVEEVSVEVGQVYPNPAVHAVHLPVTLAPGVPTTALVYDVLGRQVATLHEGNVLPGGTQVVRWAPSGIAAGVYIIKIMHGAKQFTRSFILDTSR